MNTVSGAFQGANVGLFLFLVFINDLPLVVKKLKILVYFNATSNSVISIISMNEAKTTYNNKWSTVTFTNKSFNSVTHQCTKAQWTKSRMQSKKQSLIYVLFLTKRYVSSIILRISFVKFPQFSNIDRIVQYVREFKVRICRCYLVTLL